MKILKYIAVGMGVLALLLFGYLKFNQKNINEFALEVFSSVKYLQGKDVDIDKIDASQSKQLSHSKWTSILQKHVDTNGMVDYQSLKEEGTDLDEYLTMLAENPPQKDFSHNEKLAYWINTYNAFTIKLILDHYPLSSIKEISNGLPMINSPWDIPFFKIGGVDFDLNTIEHEILRKQFDEPRIHFAINCASISCPKLRREAYQAEILERQLEEQAYQFINDSRKNNIDHHSLQLSKIFDWFRSDFTKHGSLSAYISKYHIKMNEATKIEYLTYDWGLNEVGN